MYIKFVQPNVPWTWRSLSHYTNWRLCLMLSSRSKLQKVPCLMMFSRRNQSWRFLTNPVRTLLCDIKIQNYLIACMPTWEKNLVFGKKPLISDWHGKSPKPSPCTHCSRESITSQSWFSILDETITIVENMCFLDSNRTHYTHCISWSTEKSLYTVITRVLPAAWLENALFPTNSQIWQI